jgi:hypothetical protein
MSTPLISNVGAGAGVKVGTAVGVGAGVGMELGVAEGEDIVSAHPAKTIPATIRALIQGKS